MNDRPMPGPQTQQQLRAALEQLQVIIDALPAAITQCSRELNYLWTSRTYADWVGRPADEIIGRPIVDVIGVDAFTAIRPYIDRVLAGERVEYEERVDYRGVGLRWIHAVYTPTFEASAVPTGWIAIVRDITAQRQAEAAEADVHLLAAIVESSDDAIVSKDLNGAITSWNQAAERIFGYSASEVMGRSIHLIIPDNRHAEEDEVLARIRRGEQVRDFETMRRRKDGIEIPVSLTVSPIRIAGGRIVGASKISRDVSEQKRAAQQAAFLAEVGAVLASSLDYEATLKTIAELAVPYVADWCAIDVLRENGTIDRLAVAHIDPAKLALAQTIRDRYENPEAPYSAPYVIHHGTPALVPHITDDMIVASAAGDEERVRLVRSLGLGSYMCVPLIAHGRTLGALTFATSESRRRYNDTDLRFAQDIAHRGALAVDNARAYEQLHQANRLKDEFLATLSHELRTPLNAILGYARMIRSELLPADRLKRAIETVERNASSLAQIVEDVLDVSRIISGKVRLNVQPVELPVVVDQSIESVLPAANAKGIRIRTVLDPRAAPISGDPERIQQIVWNLLSNAVKFTPRGGRVQVRLERVDSHVEIVVSDTGIGIAPEFLPHLFERFRQADASMTRERGGLGLGLAITRHLVEMHGGTIHASSSGPGTGATFRVRLPLMIVHPDVSVDRRTPRAGPPESAPTIPDLKGLRILVIDDDADALRLVEEILALAGGEVTTVTSAAAALDALRTFHPDVLIADLGMPQMNGFELIAQVRGSSNQSVRAIPAAALTAYARSEDRARALRSGFQMHLAKPIDPAELMAAVAALAGRTG